MTIRSSSAGVSGANRASGAGSAVRIAAASAAELAPWNGRCPVTISYSSTPTLKRSLRGSSSSPRACSGDMYGAVPTMSP